MLRFVLSSYNLLGNAMTLATQRPCSQINCHRLTRNRYCDEHEKERAKRSWSKTSDPQASIYDKQTKRKRNPIYATAQWRAVRLMKLRRNPTCEADDCRAFAREIDHVVSLNAGGAPFDMNNLQSLCTSCHARKTAREYHAAKVPAKTTT